MAAPMSAPLVLPLSLVLLARTASLAEAFAGYTPCEIPTGVTEVECKAGSGGQYPVDCAFCGIEDAGATECAQYHGEHANPQGHLAILIFSATIGAVMAFGIGGNDSANSWGTSVGSGAIPLRWACLLGGFGELLGATFLGAGVSSTVQKGVAEIDSSECWACGSCNSNMAIYQFGMFGSLCGAAFFLLLVTFFKMPVSTTHAIIGGVVGMTWVGVGGSCLNWGMKGLGGIIASWVISPIFSGLVGMIMYLITYFAALKMNDPVQATLIMVPLLYGITSAVMIYLILLKSPITKKSVSPMLRMIISAAVLVVVPLLVQFLVMPQVKREMDTWENKQLKEKKKAKQSEERDGVEEGETEQEEREESSDENSDSDDDDGMVLCAPSTATREQTKAKIAFRNLLVYVAFLESFAHGANDTANATGPFGAIYNTYSKGIYACEMETTLWYIMMAAGFFVFIGVNTMGYRVIETMGEELTEIDYHVGYCVEFASGFAVVVATILKMPVSTTHCQVGAVVFIGALAKGLGGVSWSMFGKIALTWVATLPFAGGLSAFILFLRFFS